MMEEVVDVPFGVPHKDQRPADMADHRDQSTATSSSVSLPPGSLPTVPVTACMFQEQFEKEIKNMFFGEKADNKRAHFKVVTKDKMLRINKYLNGGKETKSFKQFVRMAQYSMLKFPDESEEVLSRRVKITETVGEETVTLHVDRKVAAFEDFFQILSQVHVFEGDHGGMQKTWKMVKGKLSMLPRSAVRKYIELCPDCISRRACFGDRKPTSTAGSLAMQCTTNPSSSLQKRPKKRKLPQQVFNEGFKFSNSPSLEDIRRMQKKFISERDWDQFHAPRNVLLAMVGEVGEVAELFQWRGEVKVGLPDWTEDEKTHLGQELSDVLLYLIDLAERCHIDLPKATVAKMALNANKYPADRVKGSSKKYTEYN